MCMCVLSMCMNLIASVSIMAVNTLNKDLSELLNSVNGCEYTDISDGAITSIEKTSVPFNMLHLNIQSLHRNKDMLTLLLNDLRERGIVVHVIGICETFLSQHNTAMADLENYQAIHTCREERSSGSTSLFVHDSVKLIHTVESPQSKSFESISAEVSFKGTVILLSKFYRPPNTDLSIFNTSLTSLLNLCGKYKHCFIGCNQNLDLLKTNVHSTTSEFLTQVLNAGLVSCISKPTRITHKSSTLIDNIYVKLPTIMPNKSYVIVDGMSDHYPCLVLYQLKCCKSSKDDVVIEKRK